MPTVIDSLVVELALDPTKFTDGQRESVSALRRMQEEAESAGKRMERVGHNMTDVFGVAKKGALGLLGAFVGVETAQAIDRIAALDANVSRMARSIGTSTENLSQWEGAVRQVGGAAGSAISAISGLQNELNKVALGAGFFSGPAQSIFNRVGDVRGMKADDVLTRVARFFDQEVSAGRMTRAQEATQLRFIPGMNEDMINLMLKGADAMEKMRSAARAFGAATKESGEDAEEFQKDIGLLTSALENFERAGLSVLMHPLTIREGSLLDILVKKAQGGKFSLSEAVGAWAHGLMEGGGAQARHAANAVTGAGSAAGGGGGLNTEFGSALDRLRSAMPSGMSFTINSGFRTHDQQAQLYANRGGNPYPVAAPGSSPHESGLAADLKFSSDAARAWAHAHAVEFGLSFPVSRDPIHVEPARARGGALMPIPSPGGARSGGAGVSSTHTSSVNIQTLNVVTQATDAHGIAQDIGAQLKRVAKVMPSNYGLA